MASNKSGAETARKKKTAKTNAGSKAGAAKGRKKQGLAASSLKFILLLLILSLVYSGYRHFGAAPSTGSEAQRTDGDSQRGNPEKEVPSENYLNDLFKFARESSELRSELKEDLDLSRSEDTPRGLMLAYNMLDRTSRMALTKRPAMNSRLLRRNLSRLKRLGYQCVTLSQWQTANKKVRIGASNSTLVPGGEREKVPAMAILLFNDGYVEHYTEVFPLLRSLGMKATFAIIPTMADRGRNYGFMDWNMIREMAAAGMEIASHSLTHSDAAKMSGQEIEKELRMSRDLLLKQTGAHINFFSIPQGNRSHVSSSMIKKAGYSGSVATEEGDLTSSPQYLKIIGYMNQ